MNELESLLMDIPVEERQEALQYYNDYFEDAGADHEDEVIQELGTPQRIAAIIKADLNSSDTDKDNRGNYTETGYQDTVYQDPKFEIVDIEYKEINDREANEREDNKNSNYTSSNQWTGEHQGENKKQNNYDKNTRIGLIIILSIFAIPVGLPILLSVFGVLLSLVLALFGILFGFGLAGLVMSGVGVGLVVTGIINFFAIPMAGLAMCGAGLLLFGIGTLFIILCVLICKFCIPVIFKGIINLCRFPFRNRRVAA